MVLRMQNTSPHVKNVVVNALIGLAPHHATKLNQMTFGEELLALVDKYKSTIEHDKVDKIKKECKHLAAFDGRRSTYIDVSLSPATIEHLKKEGLSVTKAIIGYYTYEIGW
jgi:hypothetical protein